MDVFIGVVVFLGFAFIFKVPGCFAIVAEGKWMVKQEFISQAV